MFKRIKGLKKPLRWGIYGGLIAIALLIIDILKVLICYDCFHNSILRILYLPAQPIDYLISYPFMGSYLLAIILQIGGVILAMILAYFVIGYLLGTIVEKIKPAK